MMVPILFVKFRVSEAGVEILGSLKGFGFAF
jgi:hypothetical protein